MKKIYTQSPTVCWGGGSVEVEAPGPDQAAQSAQTMPLEKLIAITDFKNGLDIDKISKQRFRLHL